ncbi:MAG: hypothetical protein P1P88_17225 [Bacteroidales bacterium]|nr:hypothetical protein [Bacteroidales bacterium]
MRKSTTIVILFITLLGCNSGKNLVETPVNDDLIQVQNALSELNEVLKKDNGALWNFKLDGPILFINRDTRAIIANEADEKGELHKQGKCYVGKFPEANNIANTAGEWHGKKWTMVALPLPDTRAERLDLLIHESFHRIQPLIGFDSLHEIQNNHLDEKLARIYLKLELEALKMALSTDKPLEHIKNALLFREYRQQIYAGAKASENSLEIHEGLAAYTGTILSGKSDQELKKHYCKRIESLYNRPTFVRSFAYFTIPVYGYFIQKKAKNWNLEISKRTNLTDFIMNFYGLSPQAISEEKIKEIGQIYNIDSISTFEEKREQEQIKIVDNYKAKLLSDSALQISLIKMSIGFNPGNITPLDSFGTVYPYARISDTWGILKVDSGGVLLSPDWKLATVSKPRQVSDSLIIGKGWNIKLNEGWILENKNGKYGLVKKDNHP